MNILDHTLFLPNYIENEYRFPLNTHPQSQAMTYFVFRSTWFSFWCQIQFCI
nr:MAG TPA: hypothetical protein [Bacteriophage sp.]